jgi:hypothetical protein
MDFVDICLLSETFNMEKKLRNLQSEGSFTTLQIKCEKLSHSELMQKMTKDSKGNLNVLKK